MAPSDEFEFFFEKEWSDGLPIIPPTEEKISLLLSSIENSPDEIIGEFPPAYTSVSIYSVAVHGVMAGCKPEYMNLLLISVRAILMEKFNLNGLQATLSPAAPFLLVNGSCASEIGLNGGLGCFGPGFRANATIGRAIRLMMMNLGSGIPGISTMSTFSSSSRYTFCIAENEAESPWEPLSVTLGFSEKENVVTAIAAESPTTVWDDMSKEPEPLLKSVADTMSHLGAMNICGDTDQIVIFSPQQAKICSDAGLSKANVKEILLETAGRPLASIKNTGRYNVSRIKSWSINVDLEDDNFFVPSVKDPERLFIIVAGGIPGPMSAVMNGWNGTSRAVSKKF
ncbi:MAG: hypothetical protein VX794_07625 [Nitrospinota bacterium]|nr:hypothetical protein [Nitrospinota bacterium]